MMRPVKFFLQPFLFSTFSIALMSFTGLGCQQEKPDLQENGESSLVNGNEASPGQFPSVVFLRRRKLSEGLPNRVGQEYLCTASAISEYQILLAAHCTYDKDSAEQLGYQIKKRYTNSVWYLSNQTDAFIEGRPWETNEKFKPFTVKQINLHPQLFSRGNSVQGNKIPIFEERPNFGSDVAVVTFAEKLTTLLPGLTPSTISRKPLSMGTRVTPVGYGCHISSNSTDSNNFDDRLRFASATTEPVTGLFERTFINTIRTQDDEDYLTWAPRQSWFVASTRLDHLFQGHKRFVNS